MDIDIVAHKYTPMLTRYAVNILHDHCGAQEIVQDTLLRAWQKRDTIDRLNNPRNYLMRMLRNRAVDYIRHHARQWRFEMPLETTINKPRLPGPEESVLMQMDYELLFTAITKLSHAYRVCVELRLTGALYDEIAEELHIPKGTVRSRMNYACKRVRAIRAQLEKTA